MQRKPTFDLARLAAAAKEGRVSLGKTRCRDILLPLLGGLLACDKFACAVIQELSPANFNVKKDLNGVLYDEYGIRIPDALLDEFGLVQEAWYVKATLREGNLGEEVFCLSLHPLESQMECVGGRLFPSIKEES